MIVGLSGSAHHRVLASNALVRMGYRPYAFSDPVRQALLTLDPHLGIGSTSSTHIYQTLRMLIDDCGWSYALRHPSYRNEVRSLISKMMLALRKFEGDDILLRHMEKAVAEDDNRAGGLASSIVITDVEQEDEVEWVQNSGGIVLYLADAQDDLENCPMSAKADRVIVCDESPILVETLIEMTNPVTASGPVPIV